MKGLGWVLTILLIPGCGEPADDGPEPLDVEAKRACAVFERLIGLALMSILAISGIAIGWMLFAL